MDLELFVKSLSEAEKLNLIKILNRDNSNILLFNWIEANKDRMSTRLANCLQGLMGGTSPKFEDNSEIGRFKIIGYENQDYIYLEELTDRVLLCYRNFGNKLLKEFHEIKDSK